MIVTFSSILQNQLKGNVSDFPLLTMLLNGFIHTDVNLAGTTLWHCLIVFRAEFNLD
jgi:hypothetical protein